MPVTQEGNIMVDGVLASCYATVDHDLAHIAMAPMRRFPRIMKKIFGEDAQFSTFAKIGGQLGNLVLPEGVVYNSQ